MRKIILPDEIFGKPVKGAMERVLSNPEPSQPATQPSQANMPSLGGFIYVPTTGLYFQKERQLLGSQWKQAIDGIISQGMKAPTIEEFRQFLIFLKQNPNSDPENTRIYNEITQFRSPYRAEWLDARFEKQGREMHILYHAFDGKSIVEKNEKLAGHLTENKIPGISLERWLGDPRHLGDATPQGLPKSGIEKGDLYYWAPVSGYVAGFVADSAWAGLGCNRDPAGSLAGLGVFGCAEGADRAQI